MTGTHKTAILATAAGVLGAALVALGFWTFLLSQEVLFLKTRAIPHDVKQVMARKLRYADKTWHAGRARDSQAASWYAWQARVWRTKSSRRGSATPTARWRSWNGRCSCRRSIR